MKEKPEDLEKTDIDAALASIYSEIGRMHFALRGLQQSLDMIIQRIWFDEQSLLIGKQTKTKQSRNVLRKKIDQRFDRIFDEERVADTTNQEAE